MAVETNGTVRMRGEDGPGVAVHVVAGDGHLSIWSGSELVGEWDLEEIGIHVLQEGFAIRAEGEEMVLKVTDEVGLADEMGLAATTPRLARKVAVAHNPEAPPPPEPAQAEPPISASFMGVAFALAGVLVLLGGALLRMSPETALAPARTGAASGAARFWAAFLIGGVLMVVAAYVMSMGLRGARALALIVLAGVIIAFAYVLSQSEAATSHLAAYGFIAGGVVVGVAVLFGGGLRSTG